MRFLLTMAVVAALAFMAIPLLWTAMHWLVFALVVCVAWRLLSPRRDHYPYQRVRWQAPRPMPAPPPRPVQSKPRPAPELPLEVQVKVEQVRRKVEFLASQAHRFPFASEDLYAVRATGSDYLPRTLDAFLALAPE